VSGAITSGDQSRGELQTARALNTVATIGAGHALYTSLPEAARAKMGGAVVRRLPKKVTEPVARARKKVALPKGAGKKALYLTTAGWLGFHGAELAGDVMARRSINNQINKLPAKEKKVMAKKSFESPVDFSKAANRGTGHGQSLVSKKKALTIDEKHARNQRVAAGVGGAIPVPYIGGSGLAGIYSGSQANKGRRLAVGGRTFGRSMLEGTAAGAVPTAVMLSTHNPRVALGADIARRVTQAGGTGHGAYAATRNAQKRGDIPRRPRVTEGKASKRLKWESDGKDHSVRNAALAGGAVGGAVGHNVIPVAAMGRWLAKPELKGKRRAELRALGRDLVTINNPVEGVRQARYLKRTFGTGAGAIVGAAHLTPAATGVAAGATAAGLVARNRRNKRKKVEAGPASKRYFDSEADRQRRLGAYAGLGGGASLVLGEATRRQFTGEIERDKPSPTNPKGEIKAVKLGRRTTRKGTKVKARVPILLGTGAVLAGGSGIAAYKHGISERNRPYR
jgi:hypothetical protein